METCIFCNKENLISDIVYEDELVMAFMDIEPINEGHVLLIPKEHYLDVDEIPDEILSHLMIISKKIVAALKEIYKPDGYSIMQNGGMLFVNVNKPFSKILLHFSFSIAGRKCRKWNDYKMNVAPCKIGQDDHMCKWMQI